MFFIRRENWWYYKIPPPIMLAMVLLAGASAWHLLVALGSLVIVVSFVGNFGYALNELFDVTEDARSGRANVASLRGAKRLQLIAIVCVVASLSVAFVSIGAAAAALTGAALVFPLAYSAPPVRLKERKWLGVVSDAAAVHLYPALLCVLLAFRQPSAIGIPIATVALLWSFLLGIRGILTHQIIDCERDRSSGLRTVVHDHGPAAIVRLISVVIAPAEILFLAATLVLSNAGPVFYAITGMYIVGELLKRRLKWTSSLYSQARAPYIPFLNNAYYEVWGPLAIACDLATHDFALWALPPILIGMFWARMKAEWNDVIRLVAGSFAWQLTSAPGNVASTKYPTLDVGHVRVVFKRLEKTEPWGVQISRRGYVLEAGVEYRLCFSARADEAREIAFGVALAEEPWHGLGLYATAVLGPDWTEIEHVFVASASVPSARVHIDLAQSLASVEIRNVSLRVLGAARHRLRSCTHDFALWSLLSRDVLGANEKGMEYEVCNVFGRVA